MIWIKFDWRRIQHVIIVLFPLLPPLDTSLISICIKTLSIYHLTKNKINRNHQSKHTRKIWKIGKKEESPWGRYQYQVSIDGVLQDSPCQRSSTIPQYASILSKTNITTMHYVLSVLFGKIVIYMQGPQEEWDWYWWKNIAVENRKYSHRKHGHKVRVGFSQVLLFTIEFPPFFSVCLSLFFLFSLYSMGGTSPPPPFLRH